LKKRTSINSIPKIHKEKEMADFRKLFYALAVVALLACFTGSAVAQGLLCTSLTGTNQFVRVEGWAELTGDIVLGCSGTGASTAPGQQVAFANITVTIPGTTITSKVVNGSALSTPLSEATLIIDDLKDPSFQAVGNYPGVRPHRLCADLDPVGGPAVCTVTAPASPNLTYDGTPTRPNIFMGRPSGPNQIVFPGVPLDPPATSWTRTIRITNIRVNATAFAPANLLSQVVAIIQFQGPAAISLNQIQTTIGFVAQGMGATKVTADNSFLQCEYPLNTLTKADNNPPGPGFLETHGFTTCVSSCSPQFAFETGTGPFVNITTASSYTGQHPVISIAEGYQSSWKPKNMAQLLGSGGVVLGASGQPLVAAPGGCVLPVATGCTGPNSSQINYAAYDGAISPAAATTNYPPDIAMDNPQIRFFTESGFTETPATISYTANNAVSPSSLGFADTAGNVGSGVADYGTRIQFTIANVPNGTTMSLPTVVYLSNGQPNPSGVMVMTAVTGTGKGAYAPVAPSSALASLTNSGYWDMPAGGGTVTYEVLFSDAASIETAKIYPVLFFPPSSLPTSVSSDLPQANTSTTVTAATFAPWYATTGNQATTPLGQVDGTPRFVQTTGGPFTLATITRCTCSLLFPWVVSDSNYVTGIVVANTSKDPTNGLTPPVIGYTAVQSSGKVQLYLFGTIGGLSAQTNSTIAATYPASDTVAKAGSYATFIVNTGFDGYAITQANFQYCHGLAFLFNATGGVPPVSYLGLVMDQGAELGRTTQLVTDALVH
jgi:hypothetical protein